MNAQEIVTKSPQIRAGVVGARKLTPRCWGQIPHGTGWDSIPDFC
jgi:hypothetical protein